MSGEWKNEQYGHRSLPLYSQKFHYDLAGSSIKPVGRIRWQKPTRMELFYYQFHEDIEFIAVTQGAMYLTVGDQTKRLEMGDIAMISPYMPHTAYIDSTAPDVDYVCVTADCRKLLPCGGGDFLDKLADTQLMLTPLVRDAELAALICEMPQLWIAQDGSGEAECTMMSLFYQIIGRIRRCGFAVPKNKTDDMQSDFMKRVMDFLEKNYSKDITWQLVHESFPYSQSYFCRLWKQHFGKSFFQSLTCFRIEKAILLHMNTETTRKISEIAGAVGFSDYSQFSHSFRRVTGVSPSEYFGRK